MTFSVADSVTPALMKEIKPSNTAFPHVFSPFALGRKQLRNRLVALPMGTRMVERGVPTEANQEHFERLAAGGVAMVIAGATIVHPTSSHRSRTHIVEAYLDEVVPVMQEKAERVHRHGALLVGQLAHVGREFLGAESDYPPMAPSPLKTPRDPFPPHELTHAEIEEIVQGWVRSSENLALAGLDGLELHAAHGYLVGQFLSKATNRRSDEFGGSFENRTRFMMLVVEAMRSALPDGQILGVRLSAEEEVPGGLDTEQTCRIAEVLAASGHVDYVSITHGTRGAYVKDATNPDGVAIDSAGRVRRACGLPVLVGQRIRDVATAEQAISRGHADLVGMARALLADPELPLKSEAGRLEEVRSCLGVNQDCRSLDPHLHCAVNAEIGRGRPASVGVRVERPAEVYVIGGGPAGMEAARVAAGRGHQVTLLERAHHLGGAVHVAALSPFRSTIGDITDYLSRELRRLRVEVNLGAEIDADDLADIAGLADHIVLATGSRSGAVDPLGSVPALSVDDVLLSTSLPRAGTAIVVDDGDGFWPAYSAAEKLAMAGMQVTVTTASPAIAGRVPHESLGPLLRRLAGGDVRFEPLHRVEADPQDPRAVLLAPVYGGGEVRRVTPDVLVWHAPRAPEDGLVSVARATAGDRVSVIGDCVTPRRISHAILEGYRVGASL
jgi:2,4-dienoyl-CoA reductase (NADPH2)